MSGERSGGARGGRQASPRTRAEMLTVEQVRRQVREALAEPVLDWEQVQEFYGPCCSCQHGGWEYSTAFEQIESGLFLLGEPAPEWLGTP